MTIGKLIKAMMVSAALMLGFSVPAMAETTIGVVNIQKIMQESKAAADVRTQLQAKQKSFQADLDSKEKSLHDEDQKLAKQRSTTDKEVFAQKVKDFQNKAGEAQREVQTKKVQLDKAFNGALEQIQTSVTDIVKQIASDKKLTVVLTASQVIYADTSLDITDEVLKRLNDKLSTVKVNF